MITAGSTSAVNSGVARPKILGGLSVWFYANSTILFGKTPLKAQNDYIFQKLGGGILALLFSPPPDYAYGGEFQTALLNWLCKARKVVVSLPNFLCILISRSLSNLKLKYTTVFKQTYAQLHHTLQSKQKNNGRRCGQRSTTTDDYYITHGRLCSMHVQDDVLHTARRCNNFKLGFIWWLLVC